MALPIEIRVSDDYGGVGWHSDIWWGGVSDNERLASIAVEAFLRKRGPRELKVTTESDWSNSCFVATEIADGPASFNAEATRRGIRVVSADPLYRFDTASIRARIDETRETILEQTRRNVDEFVWNEIRSVDELGRIRLEAMLGFLDDYDAGKQQGRYIDAELPTLPFGDASFNFALCSHFLFLYTEQLTADFHRAAIVELCRVATEVRIFPLLALGGRPSSHVTPVAESLRQSGLDVSIETVPYEFQRGGNQMMRVRTSSTAR